MAQTIGELYEPICEIVFDMAVHSGARAMSDVARHALEALNGIILLKQMYATSPGKPSNVEASFDWFEYEARDALD